MNSKNGQLTGATLLVHPPVRKNGGILSETMRKYQQLILGVVAVISLMAFLFYKHEYDRLRYTLEYLEMFGSTGDFESNSYCGGNVKRNLRTVPNNWVEISNDIILYSSFWDEGNALTKPLIRTIAVLRNSDKQQNLQCKLWFEGDGINYITPCSVEEIHLRNAGKLYLVNKHLKIVYFICKQENDIGKVPYLAQYRGGQNENWSSPISVQESEGWKSVGNVTCACVFVSKFPVSSLRLIEFISYYNILGVEKFVFFGPILTPLVRKLLDKYAEEINLFYEEKLFNLPKYFSLNNDEIKTLIEKDCLYRHRDTHENVIVLKLNEYLIPRTRKTLQEILSSIGSKSTAAVSEFHFPSQKVCLDRHHSKASNLLLESQILSLTINKESGVALIRPHLLSNGINFRAANSRSYAQHVPSAVANIYSFEMCGNEETHLENDHLPTNAWLLELIRKSLLYRKWKVSK